MAPRAHWKGFLKLSLVSCPIALYPAISAAEKISFRQVNRETGNRLRRQLVDAGTGAVVPSHKLGRGYQIAENDFLLVEDEELEAARQEARERPFTALEEAAASPALNNPVHSVLPRSAPAELPSAKGSKRPPSLKLVGVQEEEEEAAPSLVPPPAPPRPIQDNRTIELDRFVQPNQIGAAYYNTPYFIVPTEAIGQQVFAVIRDALADKKLVGLGRVVLAKRERPILIEPIGDGLRGITLRYAHEVRDATEYFADIPKIALPDEAVRMAEHIVDTKTQDFDPSYLEDRYRTVVVEKLRDKQMQLPAQSAVPPSSSQNVVNLMEALKRSIAAEAPSVPVLKSSPVAPIVKPSPRRKAGTSSRPADKRSAARGRKTG